MSYVRWGPDSDVYVYSDVNDRGGEIRCCSCHLVDLLLPTAGKAVWSFRPCFIAANAAAMIQHLENHLAAGHKVPKITFTRLRREATQKPPRHPVHFLQLKGRRIGIDLRVPLCGYHNNAHFRKMLGIKKGENGHAHPRDELTINKKRVTCRHCKALLRVGKTSP